MINRIKDIFNNKKIRNIIIISFVIVLLIIIIFFIISKRVDKKDMNTATYNEIKSMIDNKDTFLIYYYNSKSKNKHNNEIKKYLDEKGIKYFNYNDVLVDRDEYNKLLELLNMDKDDFGIPSLIYIKDGTMYANIINIDSKNIVDSFIDNYDLYTVK